jgi:hypothetical protein
MNKENNLAENILFEYLIFINFFIYHFLPYSVSWNLPMKKRWYWKWQTNQPDLQKKYVGYIEFWVKQTWKKRQKEAHTEGKVEIKNWTYTPLSNNSVFICITSISVALDHKYKDSRNIYWEVLFLFQLVSVFGHFSWYFISGSIVVLNP